MGVLVNKTYKILEKSGQTLYFVCNNLSIVNSVFFLKLNKMLFLSPYSVIIIG